MTLSLKDQLLGLGFKSPVKPEKPSKPALPPRVERTSKPPEKPQQKLQPTTRNFAQRTASTTGQRRPKPSAEEMDLAKAYAIRAQREKQERIETEQRKQDDAKRKREAKAKVVELLKGQSLNQADAEFARHFEYGGKIRRCYVSAEQLKALNAGELAIVQLDGRYHVVVTSVALEVEALLPSLLALRIDPNAPAVDDPYADPQYQVPDDLIW